MSESNDTTLALNVRLNPSESSVHPRTTNHTNAGIALGIDYLNGGFVEPALLAAIEKTAKDGHAAPKGLEGHVVTRVAIDIGALARLQQQIQQMLWELRGVQKPKSKN
ncbi:MAG: hypothetical protein OEV99_15525 [Nitrospira sp.]|nr:hypothetical protein [Nitrospira sp.]MDH4371231.1 hypothetical protein [Nitrospira sp.]MDH5498988.1 hypothetical protein [Nitrospira sp.]MDH5726044.1 hypothetical protein [Nitrospira sp.]